MERIDGARRDSPKLPEGWGDPDGQQRPIDSGFAGRYPSEVVAELEDDLDLDFHDPPDLDGPTWISVEELDDGWKPPTWEELGIEEAKQAPKN